MGSRPSSTRSEIPPRATPRRSGRRKARGVTKSITTYVGKPIAGKEIRILDTPGVWATRIRPCSSCSSASRMSCREKSPSTAFWSPRRSWLAGSNLGRGSGGQGLRWWGEMEECHPGGHEEGQGRRRRPRVVHAGVRSGNVRAGPRQDGHVCTRAPGGLLRAQGF
eukprot:4904481-Prymnesium_polylepis.1